MTLADLTLIDAFERDGVVPLRGVFDEDWIEELRAAVDRVMAAPGPTSKEYARDGKGRFFTDHQMRLRDEGFRRFLADSPAVPLAASLLRARKLNLIDEHLLVKEPGTDNPTYWHQDLPYFEVRGRQFGSFWIPLDPVTRDSGRMRFVKGSHLWGKVFQPIRIGLGDKVEEAGEYDGPAPDIDAAADEYDVLEFDLAPGDCVFFHAAVLHGAHPNRTPNVRRRAHSLRFAGDDARFEPRPYIPSQSASRDLVAGGPLDSEQYPVVWTV